MRRERHVLYDAARSAYGPCPARPCSFSPSVVVSILFVKDVSMKKLLTVLALAPLLFAGAPVQAQQHGNKEVQADIQRHRAMATAHETAAKCLESGKAHDLCQKELQLACKDLAIGKYCGMKHAH